MTEPAVRTYKKGGSRFYVHPITDESAVGVTSVLNMLPKDFLKFWAAKVVAEAAYDGFGSLADFVRRGDRAAAVDWAKRAPFRTTDGAANVGTEVHSIYERMANGDGPGRVHPDLQPYVDNFDDWLNLSQPEFLYLEHTVWNDSPLYAGSFDAIAVVEGQTVIIDWKTTRSGVHAEVALQLNAYGSADRIILPNGEEEFLPELDGAAVFWSRPEEWALTPVLWDPELLMPIFEALTKVLEWDRGIARKVVGNPIAKGFRDAS